MNKMERDATTIKNFVREHYGRLARKKKPPCCAPQTAAPASCCPGTTLPSEQTQVWRLYRQEELENLPEEVTGFSLGCGNPTAIAELSEAEVVLDLGSGGGIDCFLAAQKVGAGGRVIGLDMAPEMIQLARDNAQKIGASNVEFHLGEMEHMPVEDNSVDVIISNCVINLSPDKDTVFREVYRVLKPGGRLCVSDLVLLEELPWEIRESLDQWSRCVAGALSEKTYLEKLQAAGLVQVSLEKNPFSLSAERGESQTLNPEIHQAYLDLRSKIVSARIKAYKPGKTQTLTKGKGKRQSHA